MCVGSEWQNAHVHPCGWTKEADWLWVSVQTDLSLLNLHSCMNYYNYVIKLFCLLSFLCPAITDTECPKSNGGWICDCCSRCWPNTRPALISMSQERLDTSPFVLSVKTKDFRQRHALRWCAPAYLFTPATLSSKEVYNHNLWLNWIDWL